MRFTPILTSEQAATLFDLVKEHRAAIVGRTSAGIWDGLLVSLAQIDRGGGALLRGVPIYGGNVTEAAILPVDTYVAWPGITTVPGPFLDLAEIPDRPLTICRTKIPLALVPLPPAALPPLPLR